VIKLYGFLWSGGYGWSVSNRQVSFPARPLVCVGGATLTGASDGVTVAVVPKPEGASDPLPALGGAVVRVQSLNNVPSQVRTLVVPEVPGSVRGDFGRFWAVLFNFGRF